MWYDKNIDWIWMPTLHALQVNKSMSKSLRNNAYSNQPNENFLEFNTTKHSVILHLALWFFFPKKKSHLNQLPETMFLRIAFVFFQNLIALFLKSKTNKMVHVTPWMNDTSLATVAPWKLRKSIESEYNQHKFLMK